MSNIKRNVHKSGPIGMLIESGEISSVNTYDNSQELVNSSDDSKNKIGNLNNEVFRTKTGIIFSANELIQVNPSECEPWKYANRQEKEIGDIAELVESIRQNGQLQPVLIRDHPHPHGNIKYEIIFGRRRHIACNHLGISLLAIKKQLHDNKDAIASQDAENRYRNNVSSYSNAVLYKKLLSDGLFKEEKEIANKLGITKSSFSELMTFNKIPPDIIQLIPDVHNLSVSMALKINSILKGCNRDVYQKLLKVSPQIGTVITSPDKLEKTVFGQQSKNDSSRDSVVRYTNQNGKELFTVKEHRNGGTSILINKALKNQVRHAEFYEYVKRYLSDTTN